MTTELPYYTAAARSMLRSNLLDLRMVAVAVEQLGLKRLAGSLQVSDVGDPMDQYQKFGC